MCGDRLASVKKTEHQLMDVSEMNASRLRLQLVRLRPRELPLAEFGRLTDASPRLADLAAA